MERESNTDGKALSPEDAKLSIEISVALFDDSRQLNPSLMAAALAEKTSGAGSFQLVQAARALNGEISYPEHPFLNQLRSLDQKTVDAVLENPLTKQALPFETIGFLQDKLDDIRNPKSSFDGITIGGLTRYRDSRRDASPIETAVLNFAIENFDALENIAGGRLNRASFKPAWQKLHDVQRLAKHDDDMKYLKNHYFEISNLDKSDGISADDVKLKRASAVDLDEMKRLDSINRNLDQLTDFATTDGAERGSMFRFGRPSRSNSSAVTASDIEVWQRNAKALAQLGLRSDSDPSIVNYYATARSAISGGRSMADEVLGSSPSR